MKVPVVTLILVLLSAVAFSREKDKSLDKTTEMAEEKRERFLSPESPLNHEFLDLKKASFCW